MTVQEQYVDTIRQRQQAWADVFETLTENTRAAFSKPAKSWGLPDPSDAVDQVFDFWKKTLDVQHEVAKQLVSATVTAGATFRDQAESVGEVIRGQAESAGAAVRQQTESVLDAAEREAEAAEEKAAEKYDELTKDELQDELASRNLPKSGTVEELRKRLVADDQK